MFALAIYTIIANASLFKKLVALSNLNKNRAD
jgi:hypothetical protein